LLQKVDGDEQTHLAAPLMNGSDLAGQWTVLDADPLSGDQLGLGSDVESRGQQVANSSEIVNEDCRVRDFDAA
jgi:hypothetical protein